MVPPPIHVAWERGHMVQNFWSSLRTLLTRRKLLREPPIDWRTSGSMPSSTSQHHPSYGHRCSQGYYGAYNGPVRGGGVRTLFRLSVLRERLAYIQPPAQFRALFNSCRKYPWLSVR